MYDERPSTRVPGVVLWRAVTTGAPTRILPDGCMDIVVIEDRAIVAGADTTARRFTSPLGRRYVGARFAPGLLPAILGTSAQTLVDRVVGLDELDCGRPLSAVRGDLAHRVLDAEDPLDCLDGLLAPLATGVEFGPAAVRVTALLAVGVPVATVAAEVGYSRRQLQRRSAAWFGYGPKHLSSVLRLQRAMALARRGIPASAAAHAAGYADHAHLIRDSRRLSGCTFAELIGPTATATDQAGSGA